jgi:hypothetical protein
MDAKIFLSLFIIILHRFVSSPLICARFRYRASRATLAAPPQVQAVK